MPVGSEVWVGSGARGSGGISTMQGNETVRRLRNGWTKHPIGNEREIHDIKYYLRRDDIEPEKKNLSTVYPQSQQKTTKPRTLPASKRLPPSPSFSSAQGAEESSSKLSEENEFDDPTLLSSVWSGVDL